MRLKVITIRSCRAYIICVLILLSLIQNGCNKNSDLNKADIRLSIRLNEYLDEQILDVHYDKPYLYGVTSNHLLLVKEQIDSDGSCTINAEVFPIGGSSICSYGSSVYIFSENGYIGEYEREGMQLIRTFDVSDIAELHMYMGDMTRISACQDKIVIARGVYVETIDSDMMQYFLLNTNGGEVHDISNRIHGDDQYSYSISISWVDENRISLVSTAHNEMRSPEFTAYIYSIEGNLEYQHQLDFWASDCIYDVKMKSYIYSSDGYNYYCYNPTEGDTTKLLCLAYKDSGSSPQITQPIGKLQSCGDELMIYLPLDNIIEIYKY